MLHKLYADVALIFHYLLEFRMKLIVIKKGEDVCYC
jgi:hypothetical protein